VSPIIVIVVLFALFWLVLIRPQRRRANDQRQLLTSLEPGDEIVSTGGLYGVIREVDGDELRVEIADGLVVRMARRAVAGIVEHEEHEEEETGPDEPHTEIDSNVAGPEDPKTAGPS
jgi:preprotein translocase subunit YajC